MRRVPGELVTLLALAWLACAAATAADIRSVALLDFEILDDMRAYASEPDRRALEQRAALVTGELARELERRDMYRVIDRAPAAALIERFQASSSLLNCNGCEIDIGTALGAQRIALCWVQRVSNLILNVNIEVRDVATGATVYTQSVDIRGNTDESWLRGVRRLVDNVQERALHLR